MDSRPSLTIIVDVLRMLANWSIRMLRCGRSPQLFKPPQIVVSQLCTAVSELEVTLEKMPVMAEDTTTTDS